MDERISAYFFGRLSQKERLQLLREVECDEVLKLQFIEFQNTYALMNLGQQIEDRTQGKEKLSSFMRQRQRYLSRLRMIRWAWQSAAAIMLVMVTVWATSQFMRKQNEHVAGVESTNILSTPAGQRAQLILQDGTEVWLNAKSKLTYPAEFTGNERRVSVEGEAFFKVAKNSDKPFIVTTKDVDVKVCGTQFNIYSYPETDFVQTSLIEGSVYVSLSSNPAKGVYLSPDEQVTVRNGKMAIEPIPLKDHFLWLDGIYAFEREPLTSILKKLELYYDVQIVIEDASLLQETYTGKFRQRDSLDDVFRILQQISKFKIRKNVERNIITISK